MYAPFQQLIVAFSEEGSSSSWANYTYPGPGSRKPEPTFLALPVMDMVAISISHQTSVSWSMQNNAIYLYIFANMQWRREITCHGPICGSFSHFPMTRSLHLARYAN